MTRLEKLVKETKAEWANWTMVRRCTCLSGHEDVIWDSFVKKMATKLGIRHSSLVLFGDGTDGREAPKKPSAYYAAGLETWKWLEKTGKRMDLSGYICYKLPSKTPRKRAA